MEQRKKKIENFVYEIGKGRIEEFIALMDRRYNEIYQEYMDYQNAIYDDDPRFNWFNPEYALKFMRTWKLLMNEADPRDRNLVLAFLAYDCDYAAVLEVFNGAGCSYKTEHSLRVLICAARKRVRELYYEKYRKETKI